MSAFQLGFVFLGMATLLFSLGGRAASEKGIGGFIASFMAFGLGLFLTLGAAELIK